MSAATKTAAACARNQHRKPCSSRWASHGCARPADHPDHHACACGARPATTDERLVCDTCDQVIPLDTERECLGNNSHLHHDDCVTDCDDCLAVIASEGNDHR